jgi:hypothetical protein
MTKVTVVIPTLNEEESIGEVLDAIPRDVVDEILIVDGNSTDRTVAIAHEKGARTIIELRRGYGRAYKTGFANAEGDIIVTMDGDGTYPAEAIGDLVRMLEEEGLDFISCERMTRMKPGAMSWSHKFGNWVLTKTLNLLFRMNLKDSQTGMWVFRKKILEKMRLTSDGMPLSEEIKIEAWTRGFKCKEVPIEYRPRKGEVKLNTWGDGLRNLRFLFAKRFSRKLS